jgi:GT2 family glycosyltransferase
MVKSVRESTRGLDYEIILVDCNSTDGTREWIRQQPDIVLIEHPAPRGSVIAFNDGFSHAREDSRYVVTLNDDIAIDGDTIKRAFEYLEAHPHVGQVAFHHKYQNRTRVDATTPIVQQAYGYMYGQCCMTRKWLGDWAGWWGDEGFNHYGGDTRLSLRLWEMGWSTVAVDGCAVIDWEHVDELRETFSYKPRRGKKHHPDHVLFAEHWSGRLPAADKWIAAPSNLNNLATRVLQKAANKKLRTLRFKLMMRPHDKPRTACIEAFAAYGPTKQVNQNVMRGRTRAAFYNRVKETIDEFKPDLVMFQFHGPDYISAANVRLLLKAHPDTYFFNWDGDFHHPMLQYHADIARAVHLQLTISPDLFPWYVERGAANIGYWPISVEQEFLDVVRRAPADQINDVVFLGTLHNIKQFPESATRKRAALAFKRAGVDLKIYGWGWDAIGIKATDSIEQFDFNPQVYARSKMSLSISQSKDLWGYTSDRLYNITATGCPALVYRFSGMEEHGYIDGVTCIAWSDSKEMMDKVAYYLDLAHTDEREAIGRAGREVVLGRHLWTHRIEGFFRMLERERGG